MYHLISCCSNVVQVHVSFGLVVAQVGVSFGLDVVMQVGASCGLIVLE